MKKDKLKIGEFTISESVYDKDNVCIEKEDGEGGDFKIVKLEKFIKLFYELNF